MEQVAKIGAMKMPSSYAKSTKTPLKPTEAETLVAMPECLRAVNGITPGQNQGWRRSAGQRWTEGRGQRTVDGGRRARTVEGS